MPTPDARQTTSTPPGRFATASTAGKVRNVALAILLTSPLLVYLFSSLPSSVDWIGHYWLVARSPLHPYSIRSFFNPPWFAVPLVPLGLLPMTLGQAINALLNMATAALIVVRYGGKPLAIPVALTSLPVATLLRYGNVEWVPMAAFLFPSAWTLPLLLAKPQAGLMAVPLWLRRARNRALFLLPSVALIASSLIIWPSWPVAAVTNMIQSSPTPFQGQANIAPWPWLIPFGAWLMYRAWKSDDDLLAVGATLCLSPYFVIHSATLLMALLSARSTRWAAVTSVFLWAAAIGWHWASPSLR